MQMIIKELMEMHELIKDIENHDNLHSVQSEYGLKASAQFKNGNINFRNIKIKTKKANTIKFYKGKINLDSLIIVTF